MPLDVSDVEAIVADVSKALEEKFAERDKKSDDLAEQIDVLKTKSDADATDIKGRIDKTVDEIKKQNDEIAKLEKEDEAIQKLLDGVKAQGSRYTSAGQQFVESAEFKEKVTLDRPMSVAVEVKDILTSGSVATGVSRNILIPEQQSGFIAPPQIELRVESLFSSGSTSSNAVRAFTENVFTNNAAQVAEGAAKPKSEITFSETVLPIQKTAHHFRVSMEALADVGMMRSYIDGRGRYGLDLKVEDQLLTGDGTGQNLTGIQTVASAYANTTIAGYTPATLVDDVRVAKLQVRKALYPSTGVVMSPESWASIELMKDSEGHYLYSAVTSGAVPTLWGLPVVTSDSMAPGDFMVGAFRMGGQVWNRMGMTVMASTEDGNNFTENMVTILFERRLALEVTRPQAFVYHDASA